MNVVPAAFHQAGGHRVMEEVSEPLRDQIGRAIYEEPGHDKNWYDLSEERREPWRIDADRVIVMLQVTGFSYPSKE